MRILSACLIVFVISGNQFIAPGVLIASAAPFRPDPLELAPRRGVLCSWSQMPPNVYRHCLQRKAFFGSMNARERALYNRDARARRKAYRARRKPGRPKKRV